MDCAQSLLFSHSVVTMLLLLLAGDVETNPGPGTKRAGSESSLPLSKKPYIPGGTQTPEYLTIKDCTNQLTTIFKHDLLTISDHLWAEGILSEGVRGQLSERNFGMHNRATILMDFLTERIKETPSDYHKFVSILKKLGQWARDVVEQLEETYSVKSRVSQQVGTSATDTDTRIDSIAKHHGLDPHLLDQPCARHHLEPISKEIVHWRAYAQYLGLSLQEESHIESNPSFKLAFAKPLMMLRQWQQKQEYSTKSHYRYLLRGCVDIEENVQLVGNICQIIADPKYASVPSPAAGDMIPECDGVLSPEELYTTVPKAFCELPPFGKVERQSSDDSVDPNAVPAQVARDKLWPINHGRDVLHVYIMNPAELTALGLNPHNVISWAEKWEHPSHKDVIPKFKLTGDISKSNIRVKIVPNGRSYSNIGVDAELVHRSRPTMVLGLIKGKPDYNCHIGVHEFGHALGLEHEHQRSRFWTVADKFVDIDEMRRDPNLKNTDIDRDYLECQQAGVGSANYDSDSVMHYWFNKKWLKDKHYHKKVNIENDSNLSNEEKHVLLGIHKRHCNGADSPSIIDHEFLAECYRNKQNPAPVRKGPQLFEDEIEDVSSPQEIKRNLPSLSISRAPGMRRDSSIDDTEKDAGFGESVPSKQHTIKIGVIGATNSGKSTTLNALLRGRFLPTSSGGTTAHVLCIKHYPSSPNGELYMILQGRSELLASGKDYIYHKLEELNDSRRAESSSGGQAKLELRVAMPFLSNLKCPINLELYDTPGTSEDEESQIYKDAKQVQDRMECLILVLSQDTALHRETTDLLTRLRERFPRLMSHELIVLMNKYDLFFDKQKSLADQKYLISRKIQVDLNQMMFCSAKLGLEARSWQADFESVDEDEYDDLKVNVKKMPGMKDEVNKLQNMQPEEKVKQLSVLGENSSCICAVEKRIITTCSHTTHPHLK